MGERTDGLVSTGGLAARLGVSVSGVKDWERRGVVPPGIVVEGSGRKVWRLSDLAAIRDQVNQRRAAGREQTRREPAGTAA